MQGGKWIKACDSSQCVEVYKSGLGEDHEIWVRDSKDPEGKALSFTPEEWNDFVKEVKKGKFDL